VVRFPQQQREVKEGEGKEEATDIDAADNATGSRHVNTRVFLPR